MSLQIHLSAKNDELLAGLRPRLAAAREATLANATGIPRPIPVLLPSSQMGDWLQVQLARELGLSMGFEFLQPGAFFKRHFAAGSTGTEFAAAHAFWTPDRLRWQLLPKIDQVASNLGLDPGTTLTPRDRFAFAQLLAQQFDRYARYRPELPALWDANRSAWKSKDGELPEAAHTDEAWQRKLWRSLGDGVEIPLHPARLLQRLSSAEPVAPNAPLFIVGTDRLDPLLLRTLAGLSQQGQAIELHLLLPSLGYLGDVSRRQRLQAMGDNVSPESVMESGSHPLLASLGQQAVGTFLLLDTLTQDYSEWPVADLEEHDFSAATPLLQRLQTDIRQQRPPVPPAPEVASTDLRPRLEAGDLSLRIHSCHSPRRELEVLRDELLRAFKDLPGLQPEEVLVAVTDFDAYAPLAQSILRSGPNPLPVRLTAIPAREANPITVALLELLRLSSGRQTASELVELLNLAAIQNRLDLTDEPAVLAQLADTIRGSGLTHGLDATDRSTADVTGTWRAALDRQLSGSWFGPEAAAQDGAGVFVHPLAGDLHNGDEAVSRYLGWLTQLARHVRLWSTPTPATDWAGRLEAAVDDLLYSEETDDHAAATRRIIAELARVTATTPLDTGTIVDWLQPQLDNATSLHTSMGGEILLGRLDQLHGLPCRVLAILGLQDGAFPRAARRPAWDLLAYQPERFDSDPRIQDRQWFLDSLLAPKDRLILSAANRSLRTAHDGPLSSVVEELLRVAADTVRPTDGWDTLAEQLVVRHRIQPFSSDYFSAGSNVPHSFDAAAARISTDLTRAAVSQVTPFFSTAAKSGESAKEVLTVTLAQLIRFWRDPAQAWLKALQLEIAEDEADDTSLDDAPVTLDALQSYAVRTQALATKLSAVSCAADLARSQMAADRALPPGSLGNLTWELQEREIETLAASLSPLLRQVTPKSIDLTAIAGVRLVGEVQLAETRDLSPWVLCYSTSKFENNPKYRLEAYIHSLAATVQLGQPVHCKILGMDLTTPKQLPGVSAEEAALRLAALVNGYCEGQRQPLCFAPATSHTIAQALSGGNEGEAALVAGKAKWNESGFGDAPSGEGLARAASLAWRDQDPFDPAHSQAWIEWSQAAALPLHQWWQGPADAAQTKPSRKKA
jgi:exodeoxyribonuclease V gamma subunit